MEKREVVSVILTVDGGRGLAREGGQKVRMADLYIRLIL